MSIGIVIGIALRFLMPRRHPGGLYGTMILGLTGALFGGFLGRGDGGYSAGTLAQYTMAALGAVIAVFIYRQMLEKPR
ncbi:MAG: hypothetical protein JWO89_3200 [Verrucomicrobiaceae bacterium]|nr:hypothetical protein [Verrucomicrobiaceae bacterium]